MALPEIFLNIPVLAGNGPGAPVDVSQLAGNKTIVKSGSGYVFEPNITIEIANDAAGVNFVPLYSFQEINGEVVLPIACKWIRAITSNYRGGPAPSVDVGAETDPAVFATLVATPSNGSGAGVVTSALPEYKTFIVTGTFRGTVNIEISQDGGVTWNGALSFSAPGYQSAWFSGQQMRVTRIGVPDVSAGLPIVDVAADTFGAAGGSGGALSAISAGTQFASSGTVSFVNSNGMSFGMSASSLITASNDAFRSIVAFGGSASGSILSFINTNGVTFGIIGQSLTASVQTVGGTATGVGISAGSQLATTGAVIFSNSNNITWGLNNQTLTASFYMPAVLRAVGFTATGGETVATVTFAPSAGSTNYSVWGQMNGVAREFTMDLPSGSANRSVSAFKFTPSGSLSSGDAIAFFLFQSS